MRGDGYVDICGYRFIGIDIGCFGRVGADVAVARKGRRRGDLPYAREDTRSRAVAVQTGEGGQNSVADDGADVGGTRLYARQEKSKVGREAGKMRKDTA